MMRRICVAVTGLVLSLGLASSAVGTTTKAGAYEAARSTPAEPRGYWLFGGDGGIFSFGDAPFYGSAVGGCDWEGEENWCEAAAAHPSGDGDWLMNGAICQVHNFGVAGHFGDRWNSANQPRDDFASCGGFAPTPAGDGYWTVTHLGTVLPWGNAQWYGDAAHLDTDIIVGFVPTPSGRGYWLLGRDGGVFAFGDAAFHGSTGGMQLNKPVVGMAASATGNGYWLVASDGGIFSFGDAAFHGSTGSMRLNRPINGIARTPSGGGYYLVADDGGVFAYGDAVFHGSTGGMRLAGPIYGMMVRP